MTKEHLHELVEVVHGGNMDRGFPLGVPLIGQGAVLNEKDGCGLVRLHRGLVEERVARTSVHRIEVCSSLDEPGGKGVVVLADVP